MADIGTVRFPRTRRFDDNARKERVFDTKARIMGVDKAALDSQVDERRRIAEAERSLDNACSEMANYFDTRLCLAEQERLAAKQEIDKDVEMYRKAFQDKTGRREYDLSDPKQIKHAHPARIDDSNENNPVSGVQKLVGEDLMAGWRRKLQMEQQAAWAEQQARERQAKREAELAEDSHVSAVMMAQDELRSRIAAEEKAIRAMMQRETAEANKRQAEEKRERERQAKLAELSANEAEQALTANSKILVEDPSCQVSAVTEARYRKDHYKAMPEWQKRQIQEELDRQVAEARARKAAEAAEETNYARQQEMIRQTLQRKTADMTMAAREAKKELVDFQQTQSMDHTTRETRRRQQTLSNVPTEEYFAQFGTRSR